MLWQKDKVGSGTDTGHQGQPAAVPPHDLDDESSLVGKGSGIDKVDSLADSLQRRVAANGGVCAAHVVVDAANKSDNVEVLEWLDLGWRAQFLLHQLGHQTGPFSSESVGARETAITTAYDECVDALADHVLGRL